MFDTSASHPRHGTAGVCFCAPEPQWPRAAGPSRRRSSPPSLSAPQRRGDPWATPRLPRRAPRCWACATATSASTAGASRPTLSPGFFFLSQILPTRPPTLTRRVILARGRLALSRTPRRATRSPTRRPPSPAAPSDAPRARPPPHPTPQIHPERAPRRAEL